MLNNLREALRPMLEKVGRGFAATGLPPNFWTYLGLALAVCAAVSYAAGPHLEERHDLLPGAAAYVAPGLLVGGALLLASGFFDVVDGQVARATGKTSKKGAYIDSVSDKIAESAVFVGIAAGGYTQPWIVVLAAALSLLVGYARAKSDSLGIQTQGVGIGERAERLLVIAVVGMMGYIEVALWIVIVISLVTLVQRMALASRRL